MRILVVFFTILKFFHLDKWFKLSAPIIQYREVFFILFFKNNSVWYVKKKLFFFSISNTLIHLNLAKLLAKLTLFSKLSLGTLNFKGFFCETIHQTSSNPARTFAVSVICRCPSWIGSNDPPKIPIFSVIILMFDFSLTIYYIF